MRKARIPVSLIAIVVSVAMFLLSWGVYNSGLSTALLPDIEKMFVDPANSAIGTWNAFADENGVKVVVTDSIVLGGASSAAQPDGTADAEPEAAPVDDMSSAE